MLQQKGSREGVIIECPLNGQNHDSRDVIPTSGMVISNNFITVTVIQNINGRYLKYKRYKNNNFIRNL